VESGFGIRPSHSSHSVIVVERLVDHPGLEVDIGDFGNHDVRVALAGSLEVVVIWCVRALVREMADAENSGLVCRTEDLLTQVGEVGHSDLSWRVDLCCC